MVMQKSRFQQVGGFEEHNLSNPLADIDLCLRLREVGYRNILNPNATLIRHTSATCEKVERDPIQLAKERRFMNKRWGDRFTTDPCYSPNLTLDYEDFSLAWPPRVKTL